MKRVALLLICAVAGVIAWITVMWGLIFLGHLLYSDDIHNWISIAGVVLIGPVAGIFIAYLAYRIGRKGLQS
jgi:hypothetical protein